MQSHLSTSPAYISQHLVDQLTGGGRISTTYHMPLNFLFPVSTSIVLCLQMWTPMLSYVVLEIELRALCIIRKHSTERTISLPRPSFFEAPSDLNWGHQDHLESSPYFKQINSLNAHLSCNLMFLGLRD